MRTIENIQSVREMLKQDGIDPERFFPSCVGCGYCCLQATCMAGLSFYGSKNAYPCPGLKWNADRYACKLADFFPDELYIGSGCCSPMNDWRKEVKKRDL